MQLTILDSIPEGLLDCSAEQLHTILPGPTLINLKGQHDEVLFVSVLLHGNEYTGWEAIRRILHEHEEKPLPRSLSLFVGNIEAAKQGLRLVDGKCDFNRIWKLDSDEPEFNVAQQLMAEVQRLKPVMAIDVHNNTGRNPHYACINKLDNDYLQLAILFSRTVVYFISPDSVLSYALSKLCPAVTIECGKPEDQAGVEHVVDYLSACLHLSHLPSHPVAKHDIDVFHTVATVKVANDVDIGFNGENAELCFVKNLDQMNFTELDAGTSLARVCCEREELLFAIDEHGNDVTQQYFEIQDNKIVTRLDVMPSMLTLDKKIIQQDCLCYLMERYPL